MNICIVTVGTRGDVQPFVALARELQARGHKASICTSAHFAPFVRSYGIACRPMRADMMALTQSEEGRRMLGGNPLAIMSNMKKLVLPMMRTMLEDMWSACQDADVLLCHPKALGGYDIAEKLGIPMIASHPVPIIAPTGLFTNPILPFSSRLAWLNQLSYRINHYMTASFIGTVNQWREQMLELPNRKAGTDTLQLHGRPVPILYGCSPSVMPIDPAWKDHVCMSGFWYLEEKQVWEPSLELASFINSENPPIAISFSSMPLKDPGRMLSMLQEACRQTKQRAVIISGWSGMTVPHDNLLFGIEEVPHSWLFEKVAGIIHHGGAGTTAAGLRAGKPMLISPFSGDQPFWARRMHELGVATAPLREKEMSVERLSYRIRDMTTNTAMQQQAKQLAALIHKENGVSVAADYIEQQVSRRA